MTIWRVKDNVVQEPYIHTYVLSIENIHTDTDTNTVMYTYACIRTITVRM